MSGIAFLQDAIMCIYNFYHQIMSCSVFLQDDKSSSYYIHAYEIFLCSNTAEVDYVLIHNEFLGLNLDGTRGPATVTVSLLNDQECEEEAETLTLTLAYDISFHGQNPLNPAEVLVHDTVTVTILDNTCNLHFTHTHTGTHTHTHTHTHTYTYKPHTLNV